MTVWCDEDTPLPCGKLLRAVAGHGPEVALGGQDALLERLLDPDGFARMQRYMHDRPPVSEAHRREIVAAFPRRHAREADVVGAPPPPGWTAVRIEALSRAYDADMEVVARIPGVTFL